MLSEVIRSALGYPAFTVGTITGTLEVHLFQSSRTKKRSSQYSNAHTVYKYINFLFINKRMERLE
ncbi:hypothetical protein Pint_04939 [Pistacia integerrima]|uniref:Uncharacterized protein n=1 Tax=Pistacia integerrima TaxID=434235 RepID=A0ACC0Z769_9ROSI|nr:hypothetical protein Pint_04939 [Pistacia integerrima]